MNSPGTPVQMPGGNTRWIQEAAMSGRGVSPHEASTVAETVYSQLGLSGSMDRGYRV